MEKRILLAFLFSFLVLIFWQMIFPSSPQKKMVSSSGSREAPVDKKDVAVGPQHLEKNAVGDSAKSQRRRMRSFSRPTKSQTVALESTHLRVEITNQMGGGISKVVLSRFFETVKQKQRFTLFEMAKAGPLFRMIDYETGCFEKAPDLHRLSSTRAQLKYSCPGQKSVDVTFALGAHYVLDIDVVFKPKDLFLGRELQVLFPANVDQAMDQDYYHSEELIYELGDKVVRKKLSADEREFVEPTEGAVNWVAFGDRYFFVGFLPPPFFKPRLEFFSVKTDRGVTQEIVMHHLFPSRGTVASGRLKLQAFLGPKDTNLLAGLGSMDKVVDFGFFRIIASPIYAFLKWTYFHIVSNYGVAIILLTILVRLLFLPLTLRGMKSMQAMQKVQPQIQKLREKYKDNREKLNQEMMALFKTHRVNPLGGCFPILLQFPVFFALYAVLMNAVDLYQAPFWLWILDLSAKDPYYVLPILLGLSFLAQQKLTPSTAEPMTQKIMMIMPIVFTVFMLNFPAGLNLYILTSTLLGVAQQLIINWRARVHA